MPSTAAGSRRTEEATAAGRPRVPLSFFRMRTSTIISLSILVCCLAILATFSPNGTSLARLEALAGTSLIAKPSAVLITAHPDDEVMFFSPTILTLLGAGWDVHGVCLSSGPTASHDSKWAADNRQLVGYGHRPQ